jgi:hypothetical protein
MKNLERVVAGETKVRAVRRERLAGGALDGGGYWVLGRYGDVLNAARGYGSQRISHGPRPT